MSAKLIGQISFPVSMNDPPPCSVAVVTYYYAGLFGGPLSQLLKCLTAAKICAEYKNNGTSAVPVCLVRHDAPPGISPLEINFIDHASKLHCLKPAVIEEGTSNTIIIDGEVNKSLFKEIENIFPDGGHETLQALKEAFILGTDLVSSCAKWLKYLMKDYGVTIVEYGKIVTNQNPGDSGLQSRTLPVAAYVADSAEMTEYDKEPREHENVPAPLVSPCPDVTISNTRSMKTLKRYEIDFEMLFEGKDRVMDYMRGTLKSDVPDHLQKLRDETAAVLGELEIVEFAALGKRAEKIRKARAARIIYQLEKILRHSREALTNKQKTAENRISKTLDFLAPFGRRQQDVLGGAQVPLFYGHAGLRSLYERLDIATKKRQLIEMD